MPPEQQSETGAPVVPQGPTGNWQINALREQIVAQIHAAATLEATEDTELRTLLEKDIKKRNAVMADILYEFLHDPFVCQQPVINFTKEEEWVVRSLRAAIEDELHHPSDVNKKVMMEELGKLVKLTRPKTKMADEKPWVPAAYRDKNHPRLDPLTNRRSAFLVVELS